MNVFLSHAITDKSLINKLKASCAKNDIDLVIAEHHIDVETSITIKIKSLIKKSDIALFLLTENGCNSHFVQQEIGFVNSLEKPALYIVEEGQGVTGFAYGADYIVLDPANPSPAIKKATNRLVQHMNKLNQVEATNAGLLVLGLIGVIVLASD